MIKRLQLQNGVLRPAEGPEAVVHMYVNPDAEERRTLRTECPIDAHTISSALDPDEVSRIEITPDYLLLIWKRPTNYSGADSFSFDVGSIGLLLFKDKLIVIVSDEIELAGARHAQSLRTPMDVMLALLFGSIHHYLGHLKVIKMIARDLQQKINTSMENKHLIQMFNLSESLIYYINAINSNGSVLTRLRNYAEREGLASGVVALVDDLIIENNQCYKQAEIYSTVFSGLMDARGSLVNNNMNIHLRNLTIINVVFLPLNLIASIGGMSEFSMMTRSIDWRLAYAFFCLAIVLIGWVTAIVLKRTVLGGAGKLRGEGLTFHHPPTQPPGD